MPVKSVIAILGVARSGTSWLGNVFDSAPNVNFKFQPLFSYEFRDRLTHDSTKQDYEQFFSDLADSEASFLTQQDKKDSGEYPVFEKRTERDTLVFKENRFLYYFPKMIHLVPEKVKVVCIVRNPCAVISSWIKNPKEFPPEASVKDEWRFGACKNQALEENFFGFYKWRETTSLFLDLEEKFPDQVTVVRYEDLVTDKQTAIPALFKKVGLECEEQTMAFISESSKRHDPSPYSVFKDSSVIEKWRETLDPDIVNEVYFELKGTRLERFL
jgi:hypothetical protein